MASFGIGRAERGFPPRSDRPLAARITDRILRAALPCQGAAGDPALGRLAGEDGATAGRPDRHFFPGFGKNQSGGSLPSLKPEEILGAVALAECFTGCWGDVFGRGVWLGVGTFLVLEPAVFVEPMLFAMVVSPGPSTGGIPQLRRFCRVGARGAC